MPSLPSAKPSTDIIAKHIAKGMIEEASSLVEALLTEQPANAEAWHLKGVIQKRMGNVGQAITCFNTSLQYKPDFKETCFDLARTLEEVGKFELAVKMYEHLLKIEQAHSAKKTPSLSAADVKKLEEWFQKGEAFQKQGDAENAANAYRKVLAIHPDMPEALTNLGNALYYMRRYGEAEEMLLRCLRVKPWHADALNTLGTCYRETHRYAQAVAAYRQILAKNPRYLSAAINLGNIYFELKLIYETIKANEHVLDIDPENIDIISHMTHLLYRLCRWDNVEALKMKIQRMIESGRAMEPFTVDTQMASPQLQLKNAKQFSAHEFPSFKRYDLSVSLPATARNDNKLRIGYISCDYQEHATSRLITELFEQHDRNRFDIYAYSYGADDMGKMRGRIANAVDRFHDIRMMSDRDARKLIEQDGVDILVDLKGYTEGHRLGLMAHRPAPIQMHYLGFPGTTGAPFIDYFISDAIASPQGADNDFSEYLIRLPNTYQINDRKRALPESALPRSAYGLPDKSFVFADFNNSYKITPDIFAIWMRLLAATEGSVLWIYELYPEATANLKREAEKLRVDPSRIIPALPLPHAEHLRRYRHIDLVLDTHSPVCGHTTTSDALWCGVPVVTLAGESFISRVSSSLLHAVGLAELVTTSLADYEALALALVRDPERLQALHHHLEEGRMRFPLFDSEGTTRALEAAYLHAAELHRSGLAPQAFTPVLSS